MRKYNYIGLSKFRSPNSICQYKKKCEEDLNFDHEIEDGKCYSSVCRIINDNPGKDPMSVIFKETNKSPKQLYKESMKEFKDLDDLPSTECCPQGCSQYDEGE